MKARTFNWPLKYPWQMAILIIVMLLAFGLRVYRLDHQSLRGDEALTYIYSAQTLPEVFEIMKSASHHPPVYYTTIHYWLPIMGNSEFALRFPSAAASVLLVAAVAALGKALFNPQLGILAALIVALNPYHVFHAQDARSYPLVTLLGVLSTIALLKALRRNCWREWFVYGALVILAMYTHYFFPFIVIFQGLFVIWYSWRKRQRFPWPYVVVGIVDILLYLPWFLFSWQLVTEYGGTGETVNFVEGVWRPLLAYPGGQLLDEQTLWVTVLFAVTPLALGAVGLLQRRKESAILLLLYLLVPLLGIYFASLFRPIFNERYLSIASPAYFLLTAAGFLWLMSFQRWWWKGLSILGILGLIVVGNMALSNYYTDARFAKSPPWREVFAYIADKSRPGDALIYTSPVPTTLYYNDNRLPLYLIPADAESAMPQAVEELTRLLNAYDRLWLLPIDPINPTAYEIEPWLDKYAIRVQETYFRVLHVNLYESPGAFLPTITAQPVQFTEGIYLEGFRIEKGSNAPEKIEPGEAVRLTLVWRAGETIDTSYTVFTHLVGPDGLLYGQWDNSPGRGSYSTTEWPIDESIFDPYQIPVQESAPPGEYRLFVGMYNPTTGERLSVLDELGNPIADRVVLLTHLIVE